MPTPKMQPDDPTDLDVMYHDVTDLSRYETLESLGYRDEFVAFVELVDSVVALETLAVSPSRRFGRMVEMYGVCVAGKLGQGVVFRTATFAKPVLRTAEKLLGLSESEFGARVYPKPLVVRVEQSGETMRIG